MAKPRPEDIQGLVKTGYGSLKDAVFLLYRVTDPAQASRWLEQARPTSIADLEGAHAATATQLALTSAGLRALGLPGAVIGSFAGEFVSGMAGEESRSRRLGDVAGNAPDLWEWGWGEREPHLMVMLYAQQGGLSAWRSSAAPGDGDGLRLVKEIRSDDLNDHEPFGFFDGASQPWIDWQARRTPNTRSDLDYGNILALGEVLLGYPNEYDELTDRPLVPGGAPAAELLPPAEDQPGFRDAGVNGSYLVIRQIDQHVREFWRYMSGIAGENGAVRLAEMMIGRRMTGEPLVPPARRPIRGVGPDSHDKRLNGFTFASDVDGAACPFGAHIRRANPRTGDLPGGKQGVAKEILGRLGLFKPELRRDVIASARFHRLLRRGRAYGRVLSPAEAILPDTPDPRSGLSFVCLNANITRQFEFVQNAWLVNPKFGGLTGEGDPLLGSRSDFPAGHRTDSFSTARPNGATRRLRELPRFTTVRGGAYFFLPSLSALRYIAAVSRRLAPTG